MFLKPVYSRNRCSPRKRPWPFTLSNIYKRENDLPNSVNSKLILYADDAVLICNERDDELLRITLEKKLLEL